VELLIPHLQFLCLAVRSNVSLMMTLRGRNM